MTIRPVPSAAAIGGRPIHAMLVPFPVACFTLTLIADIAYWQTANLIWQRFAEWLLFGGLVFGGLAALAGIIDLLARARLRGSGHAWIHGIGNLVVLALALVNSLVHARDGWTGVVPWGLGLSAVTVLVLLVTGWIGLSMVFRHGAGSAMRLDRLAYGPALLAALVATAARADDFDPATQIGPDPQLPAPQMPLMTELRVADVVGWADGQTPSVPDGLAITAYATGLVNPRTVHTLPNGDVLVVQSRGPQGEPVSRPKDVVRGWIMSIAHGKPAGPPQDSNLITLLRDTDRDGAVDERSDLLTGLHSPFGVAWADDTLYVAATDAILAYPYRLGEARITAAPKVLTPLPGGPINHHWTKDLALSPDGQSLFVSVGSNSNIVENGLEAEKGRAAIWQVDRQTGAARVYASGLRNPNGLTFNPDTGALWTVVNERDELGPNLVPDYMTSVREGAFYGWPWSYYGQHVDPRVRPERPDMVQAAIAPDYALSSHVAPLGMVFTKGSALPAAWQNGAFVGEHGSWNRDQYNGYRVVYVPFADGKPDGMAQDVVTGFVTGDEAKGRPVGLGLDGTGALLVADDAGNTVWRVAAADGAVSDRPIGTDQMPQARSTATAPVAAPSPEPTGGAPSQAAPSQTDIAPATLPAAPRTAAPQQP